MESNSSKHFSIKLQNKVFDSINHRKIESGISINQFMRNYNIGGYSDLINSEEKTIDKLNLIKFFAICQDKPNLVIIFEEVFNHDIEQMTKFIQNWSKTDQNIIKYKLDAVYLNSYCIVFSQENQLIDTISLIEYISMSETEYSEEKWSIFIDKQTVSALNDINFNQLDTNPIG